MGIPKYLSKLFVAIALPISVVVAFGLTSTVSAAAPEDEIVSFSAVYDDTTNHVYLSWEASTPLDGSVDGYHLSWSLKGQNDWADDYTLIGQGSTAFGVGTAQGLIAHRAYDFRITAFNEDGDGDPLYSDPVLFGPHVYRITNCDELQDIDADLEGEYVLMNDIDCSSTEDWDGGFSPISGTSFFESAFVGTFDGRGHTISGLYSNRPEGTTGGLFGTITGEAIVKNLTLDECMIYGGTYTGGLVGIAYGTVTIDNVATNCLVAGYNTESLPTPVVGVGGVAGVLAGYGEDALATMTKTHSKGGVGVAYSDSGDTNMGGGLIGLIFDGGVLTNSYSTATIISGNEGNLALGGLVGGSVIISEGPRPIIYNTYSAGQVMTLGGNTGGGLIGLGFLSDVQHNFAASHIVTNEDSGDTGGLIGTVGYDGAEMTLENNYIDTTRSDFARCIGNFFDPQAFCTQINTDDTPDADYFFGNYVNEPMNSWDFDTIWQTRTDDYPTLRTVSIPPLEDDSDDGESDGGHESGSGGKHTTGKDLEKAKDIFTHSDVAVAVTTETKTFNLDDFSDYLDGTGYTAAGLKVGQVIHFNVTVNGEIEHHTLTVKEIGDNYVIVTVASTPFDVRLDLNRLVTITVNGQDVMTAELTAITADSIDLNLAKIVASDNSTTPDPTKTTDEQPAEKTSLTGWAIAVGILVLLIISIYVIARRHREE